MNKKNVSIGILLISTALIIGLSQIKKPYEMAYEQVHTSEELKSDLYNNTVYVIYDPNAQPSIDLKEYIDKYLKDNYTDNLHIKYLDISNDEMRSDAKHLISEYNITDVPSIIWSVNPKNKVIDQNITFKIKEQEVYNKYVDQELIDETLDTINNTITIIQN